jgi:hypothetical protein
MDRWAWKQLGPWMQLRATLPVGALFCVLRGPTAGRPWRPQESETSYTTPPLARVCDADSRLTNSDTPTQWRCRGRAYRC